METNKYYSFTRQELKKLKAVDFKEGDRIDLVNRHNELIYTIHISFGEFSRPLKTTVDDKDWNTLNCTAGTKGGWPYYIANFIHS